MREILVVLYLENWKSSFCYWQLDPPSLNIFLKLEVFEDCQEMTLVAGDSPKLLNIAAWQLLNQLGSEILLQISFVPSRREAGFGYPDIWHSPIIVWQ
jgi:hypothetical protein